MKPIFLHQQTLWFLAIIVIITPALCTNGHSSAKDSWYPSNPELQKLYDGCQQLENLSFILKTLVDGTHFDKTLKNAGSSFFGIILNMSDLGEQSLRALEQSLGELKQYYGCVVQPDQELRTKAESTDPTELACANIQCRSKQSCIGATIGETASFLTPLIHSLLGKVVDTNTENTSSYQVESGLLMNLNTFAREALEMAEKTGLASVLGSSGTQLTNSLKKNLERLQIVANALTVAGNDILFALQTAAPLIGGKEYIEALPKLSDEERAKLLAEQIDVDIDSLDELTMDDFLL
ncbi:TPA: hypothetical protein DCW54_02675 [Candidatus Dependentiae bacterium]|nr:hypothetical protein [Candidatus Dependentiae bacterium]